MKAIIIIGIILAMLPGKAAEANSGHNDDIELKHSIDFSPLSPFLDIYAVHYNRQLSEKGELILGLSYMELDFDFGQTHSTSFIVGYRRFLWKNLHIDYQLWPSYDNFYESVENRYYKSFDVWNEFRLGYQFNFKVFNQQCYTSIQWPFGFGLYASNKPDSYKAFEKENRFFYDFPLWFVGVRF